VIGRQSPGWTCIESEGDVPVWRHDIVTSFSVATYDVDHLRALSAALATFRHLGTRLSALSPRLVEPKDF
jgi:hypothetical protein